MSTEIKLHSKVKPRYHNEYNPGDKITPSTFDCVHCNKSFPKIHLLFVLSICLPPRLLSSLSSLIVIPYPFDPGR